MELVNVDPELNLYDDEWPIWTFQEQLPPAKFVFDEEGSAAASRSTRWSPAAASISGATVRHSLLFSDVRVDDGSLVEDSAILPNTRIGRNVTLKRVILDKLCVIPDGMSVGVDRDADRQRFHVTEGGITLVTPDMLGQNDHRVR